MKLLKTNRLENPMLIVLTGEERRGGNKTLSINKNKKKSFHLQLDISRYPVVTHFTFSFSSLSPSLPEQRISVWADVSPFRVQSDRMTLEKGNGGGRGTHGCWDSVAWSQWHQAGAEAHWLPRQTVETEPFHQHQTISPRSEDGCVPTQILETAPQLLNSNSKN